MDSISHLRGGRISTDSSFFDFRGKVTAVVKHFAPDGLTLADYLRAAGKRPDLFALPLATIRANVEGVVERFAAQGLTRRTYLRATLRQPQLLQLAPATVEANLAGVVKRFRKHGLTRKDYLRGALRQTTLFTMSADTVIANIEAVVDHFRKHGLTLSDYVRATRRQSSLFYQSPATIIGNVTRVSEYFRPHGLTLKDYLDAACRQPSLFTQAPATIRANVEAVVACFGPHGLTLPEYLRATLRQPSLLGLSADRVFRQAEAMTAHFRAQGLTLETYLQAVLRQPSLLAQSPVTLISNIESVVAHFRQHGLTLHDYLRAASRRPQLFHQSPATIQRNIEEVVGHFGAEGLTLSEYLRAAIRQPSLFYQSPATIIRHIYLVIDMQAQGLVTFPEEQYLSDGSPLRPLFDFLVKGPQYFCLSDDNYALRTEYARVTGDRPRGTALLMRPRSRIEQDLAAAQRREPLASSGRNMMRSAATTPNSQAGFSLIMVSILLTVAALIFVSFLPGQEAGDINQKTINNNKKLERVEESMRSFMAFKGRRPCPADGQYAVNTANFGIEAATPGTCTGGTPAASMGPDVGTGFIVGGIIPTKTLGLDDSYAFDDYGRRFTYVVDKRATGASSCTSLEGISLTSLTPKGMGGIQIENANNGGAIIDNVMYAYISHGPTGYGAFPAQGSTVANRINSGSTDGDMQVNAGVDAHFSGASAFTYSTTNFTNVKVKKDRVAPVAGDTGFDDLVWYRPDIKNICCLGNVCLPTGFIINGYNGMGYSPAMTIAMGDINGDGIPDLIIGSAAYGGGFGQVNVIFGSTTPFPDPLVLNDATVFNGTKGFVLRGAAAGFVGEMLAVADVNKDGYADIIMGAGGTNGSNGGAVYVVYGGATGANNSTGTAWTTCAIATPCTLNSTFLNGVNGVEYNSPDATAKIGSQNTVGIDLAAGDVNGDGYSDIIIGNSSESIGGSRIGATYLVFGNAKGGMPTGITATTTAGSANVTAVSSTSGLEAGQRVSSAYIPSTTTISAVNAGAGTVTLSTGVGVTAGVAQPFSLSSAKLDSTFLNGTYGVEFDGPAASGAHAGVAVATGDINGDGKSDVIIGGPFTAHGSVYVVFGGSGPSGSWANGPYTLDKGNPKSILDGTNGIELDGTATGSNWGYILATGDVNGDGVADIIIAGLNNGLFDVVFGSNSGGPLGGGTWVAGTPYTLNAAFLNGTNGTAFSTGFNNVTGLAAGDVNKDGYADLVIGAEPAHSNAGSTYVIFGKASPWASSITVNAAFLNGANGSDLYGPNVNEYSGYYTGVLDINNDGYGDIVTVAPENTVSGSSNAGTVYVYFGNKSNWPTTAYSLGGL